jgi:hypothetical protein
MTGWSGLPVTLDHAACRAAGNDQQIARCVGLDSLDWSPTWDELALTCRPGVWIPCLVDEGMHPGYFS